MNYSRRSKILLGKFFNNIFLEVFQTIEFFIFVNNIKSERMIKVVSSTLISMKQILPFSS